MVKYNGRELQKQAAWRVTRRVILAAIVTGIVGMMFGKSESRVLAWPNSPRQQDVILDEQWSEHYRLGLIYGQYAEFEFVA